MDLVSYFNSLPYCRTLGLEPILEDGRLTVRMPFRQALIGSPFPPRLHGGTIGGMLEVTSAVTVGLALRLEDRAISGMPKPVNITIEYLREGKPEDTYATATINRLGRRIANVRAEAWQSDRTRLIATAHMHVLVEAETDAPGP
jgi:acyl-coenzyme A thioesterase PaaI-like protein